MSRFQDLFVENPMLIEVRRYRRRMLGGGKGVNIAFLTLGTVCYIGLLLVVGSADGGVPAIAIVMLQTGVFALGAPAVLNNAIAGEREKRTWDLLLAAPVTKAQIMIGKFAGAMTNLLLGAVLFLLPMFICAVSYRDTDYVALIWAEMDSIAFAVLACALTLLFSARCRRAFTALGVSLGMILLGLIVYPTMIEAFGGADSTARDFLMTFHPFYVQEKLMNQRYIHDPIAQAPAGQAVFQIVIFLCLAAVLLVWTERTLTFSDNEVKFLPKQHARS
ncbi:MAG TPA: ABC transporter permease subunit [Fimbriimonadaceae bacterium]|nr:ABC transporter permease subunit [Fimbriimonadaceae bacterium]